MFCLLVLALVVPLFFVDWFRIYRQTPLSFFWKTELVLLLGIEAIYGAAVLAAGLAFPVLAVVCLAGRRRGQPRPRSARWLLCTTSVLLSALLAEVVVFLWHHRGVGMPVLPVAAETQVGGRAATGRLPLRDEPVGLREHFPDETGDGTIDLVVVGESSAEGVPFQRWLSVGAIIKWQLEKQFRGWPCGSPPWHSRVIRWKPSIMFWPG